MRRGSAVPRIWVALYSQVSVPYQREFALGIDARHQKRFGEGATTFSTVLEVLDNLARATH
jgi:hypothetical protein